MHKTRVKINDVTKRLKLINYISRIGDEFVRKYANASKIISCNIFFWKSPISCLFKVRRQSCCAYFNGELFRYVGQIRISSSPRIQWITFFEESSTKQ
jgi:hypothetical protein